MKIAIIFQILLHLAIHTCLNTYIFLLQAQVLAVADHTNEAEKLMLEIISKDISCIECYRLLSAIHSKRGNNAEVCK